MIALCATAGSGQIALVLGRANLLYYSYTVSSGVFYIAYTIAQTHLYTVYYVRG